MDCTTLTKSNASYKVVRKRLSSLKPSPENLHVYKKHSQGDHDIKDLAASIKKHGLHQPLVITADNFIVSGHRRFSAMLLIGQSMAPCYVLPERRSDMSKDAYIALLRDHNRARHKSISEQVRETLIDIDPQQAQQRLMEERERLALTGWEIETLAIEGTTKRSAISGAKAEHVKYVKQVVFTDRKEYWPLSVRSVHYALLNYQFLRNIPKKIRYRNDNNSYDKTADLITRMRLTGDLPWSAFTDETRPLNVPRPFPDVASFVRQQSDRFLQGYWRDLLQSQPFHIEVVCEKNTIYHMVRRVTDRYQIPTSSGRGFNSIDPWHELRNRFIHSRKSKLVVIVLSDYDPEGEMIAQVGGRTMLELGIPKRKLDIIKAGVTRDQITKYNLPSQNFANEDSMNLKWFVDRNNGDNSVYELEALDPAVMMEDLEQVVNGLIDRPAYDKERQIEAEEAAYLEALRTTAIEALKGIDDEL